MNHFCTRSSSSSLLSNPRNRVPTTLYRQLLAWCRQYKDVPFNPLPPVTLAPPQVNQLALKRLQDFRTFINNSMDVDESTRLSGTWSHPAHYAMYNENLLVKKDMITFPEISDANELRAIIRSVYWLNNRNTIATIEDHGEDVTKEQISLAFDAMKSCNQLSSSELDSRKSKREFSMKVRRGKSSDGNENDEVPVVRYHVGQVVKHTEKWRGVIVGWAIKKDKNDGRHSSLTKKQYSLKEDGISSTGNTGDETKKSNVQYTVLVDSNDASLLQSSKTILLESEEDLTPVDDPCLQRIHNILVKQYFAKFDGGNFVPNKMVAYVYPLDRYSECNFDAVKGKSKVDPKLRSPELTRSSLAITEGIRFISRRLVSSLSESMGHQEESHDETLMLLSSLTSSAESMAIEIDSLQNSDHEVFAFLAKLYAFYVKINSMIWTRDANQQHKQNVNFSLGQIVKHKIHGFRGLVLAWDSTPRMDVSNWDGLVHIERPQEKPFYHIYPDANDCIQAFGEPLSPRYVCQDNLELSLDNDEPLEFEMTLDPEKWKWVGDRGRYIPSMEMKFLYAEDLGVHTILVEQTFRSLKKILTEFMLGVRDGGKDSLFSIDDLFYQLKFGAGNLDDATIVQDFIRELWKESSNCDLRKQLDNGISELLEGKHEIALRHFSEIVESDPMYGEAWNKKATVLYMMGQMENSIKSANEALRIDGRNFQALAGIGLIEMDASHYDKAIESFRRCLSINPWMGTVSSRLSVCLSKKDNGSKLPYDADSWINIQDKEDPRGRMGVQWPWEHDKEKST